MRNCLNISIFIIGSLLSCNNEEKIDRKFVTCDDEEVAAYPGTMCCVSVVIEAQPGETLQYEYKHNADSAEVSWEILEGPMTIESGENESVVTIRFNNDFPTGRIRGLATAENRGCS